MADTEEIIAEKNSGNSLLDELRRARLRIRELEDLVDENGQGASFNSEFSFRAMVDAAASAIFVIQYEKFKYINPAGERLFGRSMEELEDLRLWDLVHEDSQDTVRALALALRERDERWHQQEIKVVTPDRGAIWVNFSASPVRLDGGPAMLGNGLDITAAKQAEAITHVLYRISNAVATTTNLDELFAQIDRILKDLIKAPHFYITLFNEDRINLDSPYYLDSEFLQRPVITNVNDQTTRSLTAEVIRRKSPVFMRKSDMNYYRVQGELNLPAVTPEVWLGVPLFIGAKIAGAMAVSSDTNPYQYRESDIDLMSSVAEQVALAVDRKLSQEKMKRMATTDGLTGLGNRRHFMDQARHEIDRARRYVEPLSLLMMDVDKFKRFNDQYGHDVGDLALKHLADFLRANLRDVDIVGRIGGEEFAALLPATPLNGAGLVAERLRWNLAGTPVETEAGRLEITMSIGVSGLSGKARTIEEMLKRADRGLYKAKQTGRNKVVIVE